MWFSRKYLLLPLNNLRFIYEIHNFKNAAANYLATSTANPYRANFFKYVRMKNLFSSKGPWCYLTHVLLDIYVYVTLCVGVSKAFAGQYILYCPASRAIYDALEPGQYLDIAREGGF